MRNHDGGGDDGCCGDGGGDDGGGGDGDAVMATGTARPRWRLR